MAKPQSTKQQIVLAAMDLFHAQGVHATGVDEILKAAHAGKGQFYHYFKNKDDLTHHVLQHMIAHVRAGGPGGLYRFRTFKDVELWLQSMIEFQEANACSRSCPFGTIGAEIRDDQTQLRDDVREFFDLLREMLAKFFKAQKAAGNLTKPCDPDTLADFCVTVAQGGMLVAKIKRDTKPFQSAVKHAIRHIRSFKSTR